MTERFQEALEDSHRCRCAEEKGREIEAAKTQGEERVIETLGDNKCLKCCIECARHGLVKSDSIHHGPFDNLGDNTADDVAGSGRW